MLCQFGRERTVLELEKMMAEDKVSSEAAEQIEMISRNWGWFLALGIAMIVLGFIAIASPYLGTFAAARVFGWIMIFTAVSTAIHAATTRGWGGFFLQVLLAFLYLVAGYWLLTQPLSGAITLTVVLIAVLFVQGLLLIAEGIQIRPMNGWGWLLASGLASLLLSLMIWQRFPSSAAWALGLLFGVSLLSSGWSFVALALGSRGK